MKHDVQDCRKDAKPSQCLTPLNTKMETQIVDLPTEITKTVDSIEQVVDNVKQEVKKCGTDAVKHCDSQGKALISKISTCVGKIVH